MTIERWRGMPPVAPGATFINEEELEALARVLRSRALDRHSGTEVSALEAECCERLGVMHAVAVNSGTSALSTALAGIGVTAGDEVILPAFSYIGIASAILAAGAVPVLCEVDDTLTISPSAVAAHITSRTRAVVAVHMRGTACDLHAILAACAGSSVRVVEDCAQALGGSIGGIPLGSVGAVGCFSFQQFKVLTAGEGGLVVTNDADVAMRMRLYHDAAAAFRRATRPTSSGHASLNLRLGELSGAVLRVQLGKLPSVLAGLRTRRAVLAGVLLPMEGVAERRLVDPDGDVGVSLCLRLSDSIIGRLRRDGLPAGLRPLAPPDETRPDRHLGSRWQEILGGPIRDEGASRATGILLGSHFEIQPDPSMSILDTERLAASLRIAMGP